MLTILKRLGGLLLCCLSMSAVMFADLNPGEINSTPSISVTSTTATISWTSVHGASQSCVWLNFYNAGGNVPAWKVCQNESYTTSHSITVTGLVPYNSQAGNQDVGNYEYYVGSCSLGINCATWNAWGTWGGPATNAYYGHIPSFQTTALNTGAALNWTVAPIGAKHAYPGHDFYVLPVIQLLAGDAGGNNVMVMQSGVVKDGSGGTVTGTQVDMLDSLNAYPNGFNPGTTWDGLINKVSGGANAGKEFADASQWAACATAVQMNCSQGAIRVRLGSIAAGSYTLYVTLQAYSDWGATIPVGAAVNIVWPFTIYSAASFTATPPTSFPAIPSLATWQNTMISDSQGGGHFWCYQNLLSNPPELEYGTYLGSASALVGIFDDSSDQFKGYNYDGGRVYMQIADYRYAQNFNATERASWQHCAQLVLYPWSNALNRALGYILDEPNQHTFGLGMYYARTHDTTAQGALAALTDLHGILQPDGPYGVMDPRGYRFLYYTWDSQTANEASGIHSPWQLSGKATDVAMTNLDMLEQYDGTSSMPQWNYHDYTVGIMMEALIAQYELDIEKSRTPDPRIPIEVGKAINYLFTHYYLSDIGTVRYDFVDVPMSHAWAEQNSTDNWSDLNGLLAPALAWYWSKTADDQVRQWGDALFTNMFNSPNGQGAAKEFNQMYKWTFDFVRYRSGPSPKATFLPSQNTYTGPWPDTTPPLIMSEGTAWPCNHPYGHDMPVCQSATLPAPVVNGNSVTLTWNTTEAATGKVYYKTGSAPSCPYTVGDYQGSVSRCVNSYGLPAVDSGGLWSHSITINNLAHNTTYQYVLYSQDSAGNGSMTARGSTFTTQ